MIFYSHKPSLVSTQEEIVHSKTLPKISDVAKLPAIRQTTIAVGALSSIVSNIQKGQGTPKPNQNNLSQSMKFRESMKDKKKLLDPVEEVKNNPSASSDNLSQGGESSQQEKKKKKNP